MQQKYERNSNIFVSNLTTDFVTGFRYQGFLYEIIDFITIQNSNIVLFHSEASQPASLEILALNSPCSSVELARYSIFIVFIDSSLTFPQVDIVEQVPTAKRYLRGAESAY